LNQVNSKKNPHPNFVTKWHDRAILSQNLKVFKGFKLRGLKVLKGLEFIKYLLNQPVDNFRIVLQMSFC